MDYVNVKFIEEALRRKIDLYGELLLYLRQERKLLLDLELNELWEIAGHKERLCSEIETVREKIRLRLGNAGAPAEYPDFSAMINRLPEKSRTLLQELHSQLVKIKIEAEFLRQENVRFIRDSLQFLDELVAVIGGEAGRKVFYNQERRLTGSSAANLFCREA